MTKNVRNRREPTLVGNKIFASKRAAKEHFQSLFLRHEPGEVVTGQDQEDLLALTECHPEAEYMIGPGIDHFRIKLDEYGAGRTYTIHWVDGESTVISYLKCINGQTPHRTQVRNALRPVIAPDITRWRRDLFRARGEGGGRVPCAISGSPLLPHEGEVDHVHPDTFSSLVDRFFDHNELNYDQVQLRENWDGHVHRPLKDDHLAEMFRAWHAGAARLRFIRKDLNRSLGAGGRTPIVFDLENS
jgi:hypothetical protein